MITTIQLNENVKKELDGFRNNKETYEQIILSLIKQVEEQKRKQEELMIEGCKVMYNDMLEINKEWESVDAEIDWEWKDNNGRKKGRNSVN